MSYHDGIKSIAENEHGNMQALNGLWVNIDSIYLLLAEFGDLHDFNFKKQVFFDVIEYAMNKKWLKLAKNGEFLPGTIKDQLMKFKQAFPISEDDTLEKDPELFHIWFFSDTCPAGAVWVYILENGETHYEWT